ncbi:MAG TPA: GNAT family N-acetyltransferase [Solirubrobacteraceae bacterium]|jgi:ribosomal protein S18 acetylase RimI-like enzyme|nr:GNAT family N-acetyltransferase [Solirubrobacteraceae bacterium]
MSDSGELLRRRARDWHYGSHAAVCDHVEPWEHGTVIRAARYPTYYMFNAVLVEDEPGMSAEELTTFAVEALAGLEHLRLDFDEIDAADTRRVALEALGWKATRLLWMHHGRPLPPASEEIEVEEVPYDAVDELRLAWHLEEDDGSEYEQFKIAAREVSMTRDVRVLAVREEERPIAFAQLEWAGTGAEITQVYVHPDRRGGGRGTAMTRAAILAASDAEDLWIVADDEDRPKQLYARLGFEPAWTSMEYLRI